MASERMRLEVEKVIKALEVLGDDDSIDVALSLTEQLRGNTDAEFATWITENDHGHELWLEAAVSVRVAANQECRWTELGRDARFALKAVEMVHIFADEELRRIERSRRDAMVPPAPASSARPRFTLLPGGLAQQKQPVATSDGHRIEFFDAAPVAERSDTVPAPKGAA